MLVEANFQNYRLVLLQADGATASTYLVVSQSDLTGCESLGAKFLAAQAEQIGPFVWWIFLADFLLDLI